jgi:RNA polymerase sigma-70 factor (ECF subfamily)
MASVNDFDELLLRVRNGDSEAAAKLVDQYEADIRVAVRTRLSDPALRRQFDSMDICQSVLASFFVRAAAGQYDLRQPGQLVALLTKMARNKLAMHARGLYRQRRDVRRSAGDAGPAEAIELQPARTPLPGQAAADRDLIAGAYALMDSEVRQIADRRAQGENWPEIARALGGTPESRRKQFTRAMDRIAQQLDIE